MRSCLGHVALYVVSCVVSLSCVHGRDDESEASSQDYAIIELVLLDLTTYNRAGLPLSFHSKVPRGIWFASSTNEGIPHALTALSQTDTESVVTAQQRISASDAIAHLAKRLESGDTIKAYRPKDSLIHTAVPQAEHTFDREHYQANYPVRVYPPGYSAGQTCAVVHLVFPEILHPSYATYVLVVEDGKWKIVFRGFVMYV